MALITCRECNKEVSSEAKVCPHCGAKPRNEHTGLKVLVLIVGVLTIYGILDYKAHPPGATTSTAIDTRPPAPDLKALERANYEAALALEPKAAREYAAARLKEFCSGQDTHLNYIEVKVRRAGRSTALYCVHDLYTKYALSSGSRGPNLGRWVTDHRALLMKAKVDHVGVQGTGDFASGASFEVN